MDLTLDEAAKLLATEQERHKLARLVDPEECRELAEAVKQLKAWEGTPFERLALSINVSPKDFLYLDVAAVLQQFLAQYDVPMAKLRVEITESAVVSKSQMVDAIVDHVIHMGKELGMSIVAEGVETEAQKDHLLAAGCDSLQGFLFSPPIPVDAFEKKYGVDVDKKNAACYTDVEQKRLCHKQTKNARNCTSRAFSFSEARTCCHYRSHHFWSMYQTAHDTSPARTLNKNISMVITRPPFRCRIGDGNKHIIQQASRHVELFSCQRIVAKEKMV